MPTYSFSPFPPLLSMEERKEAKKGREISNVIDD